MEKEFISYQQALALKELGFDKKCLSRYCIVTEWEKLTGEILFQNIDCNLSECFLVKAPLKQQVFMWFREKYGYCVSIRKRYYHDAEVEYNYFIYPPNSNEHLEHNLLDEYESWEEAEIACINDLIKLVKTQ